MEVNDDEPGCEEGYPVSDIPSRFGSDPYVLEDFEKSSIEDIRKCLTHGYQDSTEIEEHLAFLEHLDRKLRLILQSEQKEGLTNLELAQKIKEIESLCMRLSKLL